MKSLLTKASSIFDRIIGYAAFLAAIMLVFAMLSVSAEVAERSLINCTTPWVMEITEYILLCMTLLAAAWVLKKEGHVKLDLVLNYLSPRSQARINTITSIVNAVIFLVVTVYSLQTTLKLYQLGFYETETVLKTPKWIITSVIPLGSLLLFIQLVRRSYGFLKRSRASLSEKESQ